MEKIPASAPAPLRASVNVTAGAAGAASGAPVAIGNGNRGAAATPMLALIAAFLGWMFDGMEMGIFPLVARPALQEMLAVSGDQLVGLWMGRITAVFLLGAAGGGLVFGWLGDRAGRVRAMSLSILTYSLFTGLCYFAREPWQLAGFRFVAALGMGGEWSLGVALVMETWPERFRPWLAGLIGAASNVGFVLIGVVGMFVPVTQQAWRWVMLVGAAPAALTFLIQIFVRESHVWRKSVEQRTARPMREIFGGPLRNLCLLAIALSSVALIGTWGSVQWLPLWADKLTHGANPQAKAITAVTSAAGSVAGCFIGSLCGVFGRRLAYFLLCVTSFGACAVLFRGVHEYGAMFLACTFAVGALTAAFYGWLPLYLPELFPTRVRATGQGVSYNFGRILAAAGAVGSGQLVSFYGGDYARMGATITAIYFVGAAVIWFAPETKGRPLPE